MDRLFGRSKTKKSSTPQTPASPSNPTVSAEDEGFAVVSAPAATPPSNNNPYSNNTPTYPVLKPEVPNGVKEPNTDTYKSQMSSTSTGASAYLDGIPFVLSSKCSGGTDHDQTLAKVESIAERIRSVDWSATQYDFRLEKSVMSQEVTNSLNRFQIE